jgi:ketosteroid isomerase-like protein
MKMKKKAYIHIVWLVLFAMLYACRDSDLSQQDVLEPEEEIKTTLIHMWDAIENEDIDLYASYIHPDFTQFGESDSTLKVGKEAEVDGTNEWIMNSKNIHTEMEEPLVVVRDSVAWIVYYWKDGGTTNGEAFSSRGKSTRIFVKEKGRWLCIHGHYTLLPSPI